jgi:DNA modification methylase
MKPAFTHGQAEYYIADCFDWLDERAASSIHGVVTDPPYGLIEYTPEQLAKRANGNGGVWRIPPSFDGHKRAPLPRFTVLTEGDLGRLYDFFVRWAQLLYPALVPGAHVMVATNPLLSHLVCSALDEGGFEQRGSIIRLVQTMRGGDRPKNAHDEFTEVSVMPKSQHEPWVLARKPVEGRVQDNLRKWGTGGLRRISDDLPFGDVIRSSPTRRDERALAPHPSLKPQAFLRQVVRAILPLGEGIVLDPFAGSGSTLAAAEVIGYASIGVETDRSVAGIARRAIPTLAVYGVEEPALA